MEMTKHFRPGRVDRGVIVTTLVTTLFLAGCGERRYRVEIPAAKDALQSALDAWKKGESPEDLKKRQPPVVVQDPDWTGGAKLTDFRVLNDGKEDGPNFYCSVELVLKNQNEKEERASVRYIVTTNPNVTVFRQLF